MTGAAGFIGSNLVLELLRTPESIHSFIKIYFIKNDLNKNKIAHMIIYYK